MTRCQNSRDAVTPEPNGWGRPIWAWHATEVSRCEHSERSIHDSHVEISAAGCSLAEKMSRFLAARCLHCGQHGVERALKVLDASLAVVNGALGVLNETINVSKMACELLQKRH